MYDVERDEYYYYFHIHHVLTFFVERTLKNRNEIKKSMCGDVLNITSPMCHALPCPWHQTNILTKIDRLELGTFQAGRQAAATSQNSEEKKSKRGGGSGGTVWYACTVRIVQLTRQSTNAAAFLGIHHIDSLSLSLSLSQIKVSFRKDGSGLRFFSSTFHQPPKPTNSILQKIIYSYYEFLSSINDGRGGDNNNK